jgi:hypothetical protein
MSRPSAAAMALALPLPPARQRVHRQRTAQREQVDQFGLGQADQPPEPLALVLGQAGLPRLLRLLHGLPCPAGLEVIGHGLQGIRRQLRRHLQRRRFTRVVGAEGAQHEDMHHRCQGHRVFCASIACRPSSDARRAAWSARRCNQRSAFRRCR